MKIEVERLKDGKEYRCYYNEHDYYLLVWSYPLNVFSFSSCCDIEHMYVEYDKFERIEPVEQPDTFQEVVEWCEDNNTGICIGVDENIYIGEFEVSIQKEFTNTTELLTHIRTPKLKQITKKEALKLLKIQGLTVKF